MNNYGILEWLNEHSASAYPLSSKLEINDLLVDAHFQQFDSYIPTLVSLIVSTSGAQVVIQFDNGLSSVLIPRAIYTADYTVNFTDANGRYLGNATFGMSGLNKLFENYTAITFTLNTPFVSSTVVGVPTKAGVYSIEGASGSVVIHSGDNRLTQSLYFEQAGNAVTWNAAALPAILATKFLKSLNGVKPLNNNINIQDSELLKLQPLGIGLEIGLAASTSQDNILPTTEYGESSTGVA